MTGRCAFLLMLGALACDRAPRPAPQDLQSAASKADTIAPCKMPTQITNIVERDGAILETWTFHSKGVATSQLPKDPAFLSYRAAIERDGANVRRPVADPPVARTEADVAVWRDEQFNNDLAFGGTVGSVNPISCLDALLFSRQATRVSQIDHPTEFLASVLRRETDSGADLVVVFGAGSEMFPPKDVYGFDVVRRFVADGWRYWYAIHNHTVQKNGKLLALGVPAPSTSDVQLYRSLGKEMRMDSLRVTNGFYTFSASVNELGAFRAR